MSISKWKSQNKGFTLVELLVVIAIIGTLATLLLLQLGVARAKARDAKRIADINQLRSAAELYFDDCGGHYPTGPLTAGAVDCGATDIGKYLAAPSVPVDPLGGAAYGYAWDPNPNPVRFQVYVELEGKSNALLSDSDIDASGWGGVNGALDSACTAAANDCIYDTGQK